MIVFSAMKEEFGFTRILNMLQDKAEQIRNQTKR